MWIENPRHQAYLISAICAALGVTMGFVVYLRFVDLSEAKNLHHELWVLVVSLILGTALAGVSELLRETIREGEVRWRGKTTAIITTAIILISFELFTHVTENAVEKKSALQNIAARIAGHNAAALTNENTDFSVILNTLERIQSGYRPPQPSDPAKVADPQLNASKPLRTLFDSPEEEREKQFEEWIKNGASTTPEQDVILKRIIQLMPITERVPLFTRADRGEILALIKSLRASPQEEAYTLPWEYFCSLDVDEVDAMLKNMESGNGASAGLREPFWLSRSFILDLTSAPYKDATPDQKRDILVNACRASLGSLQPYDKIFLLRNALNAVLARHDLFEPTVFKHSICQQKADERDCTVIEQQSICSRLRRQPDANDTNASCLDLERAQLVRDNSKKATLLPPSSMMEQNRLLLSYYLPPALAPPLAVNWFDLFMLLTVWIAAGALLAIALTHSVFLISPEQRFASFKSTGDSALTALIWASLTMGATILVFRIGFLLWQLAAHTPAHLCAPFLSSLSGAKGPGAYILLGIASIPLAVIEVNSHWPGSGWITLPICLVLAAGSAALAPRLNTRTTKLIAFSPMLGLLIFGVGSVFGSTLFLMLLVMVTWTVPAFGLAAILPYLEPTSALPRLWGAVAIACGIALSIATILLSNVPPIIFGPGCVSLIVLGIWVYRQQPMVRDAWPALAVTAAFCFMCTVFAQQATFSGVLNNLHSVTAQAPLTDEDNRCHRAQGIVKGPIAELHAALKRPSAAPQTMEFDHEDATEESKLEIVLAGTFGFWTVIALLAAWALRKKGEVNNTQP